ncbi:LCP family protein (plasmid) [Streptomyces sp. BI20]|uniref:LCP family protein n=1 Tax=Streptomyces sp. BI20 TaxID=3403460 RepID=UPI003C71D4C2
MRVPYESPGDSPARPPAQPAEPDRPAEPAASDVPVPVGEARRRRPGIRGALTGAALALALGAVTLTGLGLADPFPAPAPGTAPFVTTALAAALPRGAALDEDDPTRPARGQGTNILVIGTDDRSTTTAKEMDRYHLGGSACHCSDVLFVLHVSADRTRTSVVALPRDSAADIPAHRDPVTGERRSGRRGKINAALALGGPELTVRTVERATGLRVDHWVHVDFRRFMDTVDAVDKVPVCLERPMHDKATMLELSAGTHRLRGGPSLQYVRSRKVPGETSADLNRIQRQHRFLVGTLLRLREEPALRTLPRLTALARTLLSATTVDQGFTPGDLGALTRDLARLGPADTEFAIVPLDGFDGGNRSNLAWDEERAPEVFDRLVHDRALTPTGSTARQPQSPPFYGYTPIRGSALACD